MKVYIVRYGEYSDQGIAGVFSTKEKAEKYCDVHNEISSYDDYWIDDRELDEDEISLDAKVAHYYEVEIMLEDEGNLKKGSFRYDDYEEKAVYTKDVEIKMQSREDHIPTSIVVSSIHGFDHAKKVAIEQYQIYTQQQLEDGTLE